jgi:glycosyltransferase involved in cell wall biosynthesis
MPLLGRVLEAVGAQGDLELIVIDSGSTDGSQDAARAARAELIEIVPSQFGHGRTRNTGAERSTGDLICFLTQDAVPEPGWLEAYLEAFRLHPRVGAAYGPHLPFPDTSPMIARELTEFFAGFSPDGEPVLQRAGDLTFLSNVNACYARTCWAELRFPDQAFGRALLAAGWLKAYHPAAAVRHAHDYGPVEFMKRYFDEYRGLREASGHVERWRRSARSAPTPAGCARNAYGPASGCAGRRTQPCTRAAGASHPRSVHVRRGFPTRFSECCRWRAAAPPSQRRLPPTRCFPTVAMCLPPRPRGPSRTSCG